VNLLEESVIMGGGTPGLVFWKWRFVVIFKKLLEERRGASFEGGKNFGSVPVGTYPRGWEGSQRFAS